MRHLSKLPLLLLLLVAACQSGTAQTEQPANVQPVAAQPGEEIAAKPEHPRVIGQGEPVDLVAERDPGRTTVFDFYSEYCGPCRRIAPYLVKLHEMREDVSVVKVDINRPGVRGIDFYSPTARQHGIMQVPTLMVMQPDGTMVAKGEPAWNLVVKWILELEEQQTTGR